MRLTRFLAVILFAFAANAASPVVRFNHFTTNAVTVPIGVSIGGTGGTNAAQVLTNLGLATSISVSDQNYGTATATSPWGFATQVEAERAMQTLTAIRNALLQAGIIVTNTATYSLAFTRSAQNTIDALPLMPIHTACASLTVTALRPNGEANTGTVYVYLDGALHGTLTTGQTDTLSTVYADQVTIKFSDSGDSVQATAGLFESGWSQDTLATAAVRAAIIGSISSGSDVGLAAGPSTNIEYFGQSYQHQSVRDGYLKQLVVYYRTSFPATGVVKVKVWAPTARNSDGHPTTWKLVSTSENLRSLLTGSSGYKTITLATPIFMPAYSALSLRLEYDGVNYGYLCYRSSSTAYTNHWVADADYTGTQEWPTNAMLNGAIGIQPWVTPSSIAFFSDSRETGSTTPWASPITDRNGTNYANTTTYWLQRLSGSEVANSAGTLRSIASTTQTVTDWSSYWSTSPPRLSIIDVGIVDESDSIATNTFYTGLTNLLYNITNAQSYAKVALVEQIGWNGKSDAQSNLCVNYNIMMSNLVQLDTNRLAWVPTLATFNTNAAPNQVSNTFILSTPHLNSTGHAMLATNIWNVIKPWMTSGKKLL